MKYIFQGLLWFVLTVCVTVFIIIFNLFHIIWDFKIERDMFSDYKDIIKELTQNIFK